MKNFFGRRHRIIAFSVVIFLIVLGPVLSTVYKNSLFLLLLVPALLLEIGVLFILGEVYEWACEKCGSEDWSEFLPKKYCTKCGGLIALRKRVVSWKICENGHKVKDEYNTHKFCPKCGTPLMKEEVKAERAMI